MVSPPRFLSSEGFKNAWAVILRVGAGAGLGSLFGAYYLQGEFKRCNASVQNRMQALSKLIGD